MLTHPTLERLIALGLTGMAKAFDDQRRQPDVAALPFEDRLALMVDREVVERQNKCLATRLKFAGLRHLAVVEDIDLATPRGLDRTLFTSLVAGDWIERKLPHVRFAITDRQRRARRLCRAPILRNGLLGLGSARRSSFSRSSMVSMRSSLRSRWTS